MKKTAYLIFAIILLSSCEDFLNFDPLTQKTSETFPQTIDDVKQIMAGIYTTMSNEQQLTDMSYLFVCEIASDDKLGGGGINDKNAQAYEAFMYSNPNMLSHNWETTYEGIHRANYAIEQFESLGEDVLSTNSKNQYTGEAYFLRAFFYYRLATLYGEVPLKITTEPIDLGASSPDEIFAQIAFDLKKAIELLPKQPYTATENGRVTLWAAQAMMARVWLFYTGFYDKTELPVAGGGAISKQNAIDWLKDCIDKSGHKLVDDFHELWPYTNSLTIGDYEYMQDYITKTGKTDLVYAADEGARNPETLFALQFSNFADWDIRRGYANMYQLYMAPRGLQSLERTFPFAGGWGQANSVPQQMVDQWMADEPTDPRIGASVLDFTEELIREELNPETGKMVQVGYLVGEWDFVLESNFWGKKYLGAVAKVPEGDGFKYVNDYSVLMYGNNDNNQLSHADELVFIRFADVLLMMSELTEDAQYMNEVRDRSDLPPVAYSLENLQKERRYELAFEGLRWNDMRRWGDAYAKAGLESQMGTPVLNNGVPAIFNGLNPKGYSKRYDETKGFFPIPQSQINLSNGLLKQVKGYETGEALYPGFTN